MYETSTNGRLCNIGRDDARVVIVLPETDSWPYASESAPDSFNLLAKTIEQIQQTGLLPQQGIRVLYGADLDALRTELNAHPRAVVLVLGAELLHALTDNDKLKMSTVRGQVMTIAGIDAPILPTYKPGAILIQRGFFHAWANDIKLGLHIGCGAPAPAPGETRHFVIETEQDVDDLAAALLETGLVACDIETTGLNPRRDSIVAVGFAWTRNLTYIVRPQHLHRLRAVFADPTPRWLWHNGKFDASFLRHAGIPARVDHDSMLLSYALDETPGRHGLKQLANDILGAPDYEKGLEDYKKKHKITNYGDIPEDILFPYLAMDCDYTLQLAQTFLPKVLAAPDLRMLYTGILIPASTGLACIEENGIFVDRARLETARTAMTEQRDTARRFLDELAALYWLPEQYMRDMGRKSAPKVFNPASFPQMEWMLAQQHIFVPNTQRKTLEDYPGKSEFIDALLRFRKGAKALSTYVEAIEKVIEPDGRVHATYKIHGTVTGRLSSSDPNLQNIPRDPLLRGMFAAAPGYVLLEADFSQAELRALAHFSGDTFLRGVYERGEDLHAQVAAAIFGPDFTKEQRTFAKTINFGIAYGLTEWGLSRQIKVDSAVAKRMIEDWYARMPLAKAYLDACRTAPFKRQVMTTPFGRRRRYGLIRDKDRDAVSNEACNFGIQSAASDLMLLTALEIEPQLAEWDARLVNIVHDSVLIEVPDRQEAIDALAALVIATMRRLPVQHLGATIPFDADAKVGTHWGHMKDWTDPTARKALAA